MATDVLFIVLKLWEDKLRISIQSTIGGNMTNSQPDDTS